MSFDQAELARMLDNLIRPGRIVEVDYPAARARVAIEPLITGWLPFMAPRAGDDRAWHPPEVGEQVIVLSPSGDTEQGFILIGAIFQDAYPAPADRPTVDRRTYADGAVIEYDRAAHRLTAQLPAGGEVEIIAPGGVTINGDLVVTGDVRADGANGVSLLNHVHGGVSTGGGETDKPVN